MQKCRAAWPRLGRPVMAAVLVVFLIFGTTPATVAIADEIRGPSQIRKAQLGPRPSSVGWRAVGRWTPRASWSDAGDVGRHHVVRLSPHALANA
jgi:hypothetical protein